MIQGNVVGTCPACNNECQDYILNYINPPLRIRTQLESGVAPHIPYFLTSWKNLVKFRAVSSCNGRGRD